MKKIILSFKKIQDYKENKPEKAALIAALIIVIPMALILTLSLSDKSVSNLILAPLFIIICVGGLYWWMFAMLFGQKQYSKLRDAALKSGIELMINEKLIENGSITKPEQMVKL